MLASGSTSGGAVLIVMLKNITINATGDASGANKAKESKSHGMRIHKELGAVPILELSSVEVGGEAVVMVA